MVKSLCKMLEFSYTKSKFYQSNSFEKIPGKHFFLSYYFPNYKNRTFLKFWILIILRKIYLKPKFRTHFLVSKKVMPNIIIVKILWKADGCCKTDFSVWILNLSMMFAFFLEILESLLCFICYMNWWLQKKYRLTNTE